VAARDRPQVALSSSMPARPLPLLLTMRGTGMASRTATRRNPSGKVLQDQALGPVPEDRPSEPSKWTRLRWPWPRLGHDR
jgi:hypothetical protein